MFNEENSIQNQNNTTLNLQPDTTNVDFFEGIGIGEVDKNNFPISEIDFLDSCQGLNEQEESNSLIELNLMTFDSKYGDIDDESAFTTISMRKTKNADLSFVDLGDFIQITLSFKTRLDPELRLLWNLVEKYSEIISENAKEVSSQIPFLIANIAPDKYLGKCYLSFTNPIFWTLQPKEAGDKYCNSIRFCVPIDNFSIIPIDTDMDIDIYKAEVNRNEKLIRHEKREY